MPNSTPEDIHFYYLKNQQFRVIHVDGVTGGITPRGLIHLAVFSERPAIPQATVQAITPEGTLGEELQVEGKKGFVREIDVDLMFTKETALELHEWLSKRIAELRELEEISAKASKGK